MPRCAPSDVADYRTFEPLEGRRLLAAIAWDGGGDGSTLTDAANWAGDVLPGPSDDAVINVAGSPTITYSSGAPFTVNSLACAEAFTMTSGTLTLAAASSFSGATLFSGGTITGAGNLSITNAFTWDAGTMSGTGLSIIGTGVIMTMNTAGTKVLSRNLVNGGRINHSVGLLQFANGGTLSNATGHVYNLLAAGTISSLGSGNVFNNAGVFNDQTIATITLGMTFNSTGQVNVYGGALNIDGGGSNTGTRNIAAGAVMNYRASYTHGAGSSAAGSGIMNFNGGTQTISGNWTATARIQLLSGTLTGGGNLTVAGPMYWGAGTITGAGNITITAAGKLALTTGSTHDLSRAIVNDGNFQFLNGVFTMGGATITNSAQGTITVLATATVSPTAGVNTIDNAGTFRKIGAGTLTLDSVLGGVRLDNTGTVDVRNGSLVLNGPVTQVNGDSLDAGTWQVYPTASLALGAAVIHTLAAAATVNLVGGGASFANIATLSTNNGTLNLSLGGVYDFTPDGGTFTNNGTLSLTPDRWFRVNGNFVQGSSATLAISLLTSTRYSRIIATGSATLSGAANFLLTENFVPTPGMVFSFVQASSRSGTFTSTGIPSFPGGSATVSYTATGANLVVS